MDRSHRFLVLVIALMVAAPALACEPILPFTQVMMPTLALGQSFLLLAVAVIMKSVLFSFFERRIPRVRGAWFMFLGNILTSFVGAVVAIMIGTGVPTWVIGVPVVCLLCWLPSRRLVKAAPLAWLSRMSALEIAGLMTAMMIVSCVLFGIGQGAIEAHHLTGFWILKLSAIFFAVLASLTLTTIWEEWAIWRLSSRPEGAGYFSTVLRTNLYVLLLVFAVPAVLILPERLRSPDFILR